MLDLVYRLLLMAAGSETKKNHSFTAESRGGGRGSSAPLIDGEKRSRPTDAPFGRVPTVDRHQRRCSDVFFSAHVRRKRSFLREFSRASRFSLLRYFSSDAVSAFLGLFFRAL